MTESDIQTKPYPGSKQALAQGCLCPVMDNAQGKGCGGDGHQFGWYVSGDCPIHGSTEQSKEKEDNVSP